MKNKTIKLSSLSEALQKRVKPFLKEGKTKLSQMPPKLKRLIETEYVEDRYYDFHDAPTNDPISDLINLFRDNNLNEYDYNSATDGYRFFNSSVGNVVSFLPKGAKLDNGKFVDYSKFNDEEIEDIIDLISDALPQLPEFPIAGDGYKIDLQGLDGELGKIVPVLILTLDYLNLGNNFGRGHMGEAIKEHKSYDDFSNKLSNFHYQSTVKLKARGNYGTVSGEWILNEFPY